MELHQEDRVDLDQSLNLMGGFKGSENIVASADRSTLETMYHNLKEGKFMKVAGMTVVAMSPAFLADTTSFLPIYFLDGDDLNEPSEVPGRVVRDYEGATFLFPVVGCETNYGRPFATAYSDGWEVRESIVRLKRNDTKNYKLLTEKGFHELQNFEGNEDEVILGRHQLAREGEILDDGQNVFRVGPAVTNNGVASLPTQPSVPSLMSSADSEKEETKAGIVVPLDRIEVSRPCVKT
jgi:hypothetical protein